MLGVLLDYDKDEMNQHESHNIEKEPKAFGDTWLFRRDQFWLISWAVQLPTSSIISAFAMQQSHAGSPTSLKGLLRVRAKIRGILRMEYVT